jgi:hypothetical protein
MTILDAYRVERRRATSGGDGRVVADLSICL